MINIIIILGVTMMIIITNTIAVMIIVSGTTLSKVRAARLHGII